MQPPAPRDSMSAFREVSQCDLPLVLCYSLPWPAVPPRCPLQITSRMPAVRMPRSPPSRCGLMSSRSAASWRAIAKSGRAPAAISSRLISAYRPPFRLRRRCAVPLYKGAPAPINGYCSLPDTNLAARFTLEAVNQSAPKNEGLRLTLGSGGPRIAGTISLRDRSKDRYAYPAKLRITLAP